MSPCQSNARRLPSGERAGWRIPRSSTAEGAAQKLLADRPQLKVILMSGYDALLAKHRASLGPAVEFIPKPFVMGEVLRVVRERLDAVPA